MIEMDFAVNGVVWWNDCLELEWFFVFLKAGNASGAHGGCSQCRQLAN